MPSFLSLLGTSFKLGCTSFGGPIAAISIMEDEYCRKQKIIPPGDFHELYSICKLLPGPVATQLLIGVNRALGGFWVGLSCGLVYIFPAFALMAALSWLVFAHRVTEFGAAMPFVAKMQLAALALIWVSGWNLLKPYLQVAEKRPLLALIAIPYIAVLLRPDLMRWEPIFILTAGLSNVLRQRHRVRFPKISPAVLAFPCACGALGALSSLFAFGLKTGMLAFGTGLAIIPLLETDAVLHHQWLTSQEFMTGITLGQITPGPVMITLTYVGYKVAALGGAIAATIGVFLPSFVNMLGIIPHLQKRLRATSILEHFSVWSLPVIVGGILVTATRLTWPLVVQSPLSLFWIAAYISALQIWNWPAWLLVFAAGLCGFLPF